MKLNSAIIVCYFSLIVMTMTSFKETVAREMGIGVFPDQGINIQPRNFDDSPALPDYKGSEDSQLGFPKPFKNSTDSLLRNKQICISNLKIHIINNSVLSTQFDKILQDYQTKKCLTNNDLLQLRFQLTLLYINYGYTTSGVIIPDQDVEDGVIILEAVEGKISTINIEGEDGLNEEYFRERIKLATEPVINFEQIRNRLQVLNQSPLIKQVNGQLKHTNELGKSILDVNVIENTPYRLDIGVNNYRSASLGEIQGFLNAAHLNLTGNADALYLSYGRTEGLNDISASYSFPFTSWETALHLSYDYSDTTVTEEPFNDIDIESKFQGWSIGISHPFLLAPTRTISGRIKLDNRHSKSFLLGRRFSFSPGVENGESTVTTLRMTGEWTERNANSAFALRTTFNVGIDALSATIHDDLPDGEFFSWLGQVRYAYRFEWANLELAFRTDIQISADSLLPLEKFAVGGAYSVRGYREYNLVRDNGLTSSIELRIPIFRKSEIIRGLKIGLFADFGNAWNVENDAFSEESLVSIGAGLRWAPTPKIHSEIYVAHAFNDTNKGISDETIQDQGIHFQLSYSLF